MNHISIIVKNVTAKWQGNTVLNDVSFTMQPGEHLLITGQSGSGKTMLAKAIAGKLFHTGSVDFLSDGNNSTPTIVFVQQHYHFKNLSNVQSFYYQQRFNSFDGDDALTVKQELSETANIFEEQINALLDKFGLMHRADEPLLHLSSGEHKRFQLIKALLKKPSVIIFDEPFTGLDVHTRAVLKQTISELAANGTTIILISNRADAPKCISHILELHNGTITSYSPKRAFVAENHRAAINMYDAPAETPEVSFSSVVLFKNVSVSYGSKQILTNINWHVKHGDKWLVKGKNGAGKSTLLSLITGDNPQAYANDIYLFDRKRGSGETIWDIKKQIGYVSPELQWYFDTSINCFDAVASGFFDTIGLFKPISSKQKQQVNNWLHYFGLEKESAKLLSLLPAGKQRLVLLARAMVKNPPVLILDEPCQGLDEQQKDHFIRFTDAICSSTERTLIYVSHYASEIPSCIDHVLELEGGSATIYTYSHSPNTLEHVHT
jgi:molybdate transport system ATP-binding protein